MRHSARALGVILCLAFICGGAAATQAQQELTAIRSAHAALRDLTMTVVRTEVQEQELRRMKHHMEVALELPRLHVFFEAPDRMRLEGKRGLVSITLIQNGNLKRTRYGFVNRRQDVTGSPDKKQGGLDFGLLTSQVWTDFHVTTEGHVSWEDRPAVVLHLVARSSPEGSYHRVWIDDETLRVLQIEDRTGDGILKRRLVFRRPVKTPGGVWLAHRIEIFNQENHFVGALELTDVAMNQGLDDHLFQI
jgi:outer membrane lipoprotein-sorting protein